MWATKGGKYSADSADGGEGKGGNYEWQNNAGPPSAPQSTGMSDGYGQGVGGRGRRGGVHGRRRGAVHRGAVDMD